MLIAPYPFAPRGTGEVIARVPRIQDRMSSGCPVAGCRCHEAPAHDLADQVPPVAAIGGHGVKDNAR